jgi:hypothetical protein
MFHFKHRKRHWGCATDFPVSRHSCDLARRPRSCCWETYRCFSIRSYLESYYQKGMTGAWILYGTKAEHQVYRDDPSSRFTFTWANSQLNMRAKLEARKQLRISHEDEHKKHPTGGSNKPELDCPSSLFFE